MYTTYFMDFVEDGLTDVMEGAGRRYQDLSQELAEKKKKGEQVDFKARGPLHLHVFMTALLFLAAQHRSWGKGVKEVYMSSIRSMPILQVGEIVPNWQ